jgi:hypothetical protein
MRDKLIKEVWCELNNLPIPQSEIIYDGPIDDRIAQLKHKIKVFEENARKLKERYEQEQL